MKWAFLAMMILSFVMAFIYDWIIKDNTKAAYNLAWGGVFMTLYLQQ